MISHLLKIALAAALFACGPQAAAQLTLRDDLGRPIVLKEPAKRIVTLSPSLTELVYAVGAGNLVVGVDSLSDYPPEAKSVAQVVTGAQFSIEQLAHLKPDLVLAWRDGIRPADVEAISAFGATVFVANARRIEDVPRLLEIVGRLAGRDSGPVIAEFEGRLERVRRANAQKRRVTAFLEIWNRPLTTISGTHFLSEALEICHAENVFGARVGSAPRVSWDDVAREDPFVIVGAGSASNAEEFRSNWAIRSSLGAVKARRLVYLESDTIQRPSPRMPAGIEQLCRTIDQVRDGVVSAESDRPRPERAAPFATQPAIPVTPTGVATSAPVAAPSKAPPPDAKPAPENAVTARPRPSQYGL